jgi:hypothetical protein
VKADWAQMRIAAAVLLALWVGVSAVLSARELRFLAGVEPPQRRLFGFLDIFVQLAILGVLLPCAVMGGPSRAWVMIVTSSFVLLWAAAIWAGIARSMYTYRLMLGARTERKEFEDLLRRGGDLPRPGVGQEPTPTEPNNA